MKLKLISCSRAILICVRASILKAYKWTKILSPMENSIRIPGYRLTFGSFPPSLPRSPASCRVSCGLVPYFPRKFCINTRMQIFAEGSAQNHILFHCFSCCQWHPPFWQLFQTQIFKEKFISNPFLVCVALSSCFAKPNGNSQICREISKTCFFGLQFVRPLHSFDEGVINHSGI